MEKKITYAIVGAVILAGLFATIVLTRTWLPDWMCEKDEAGVVKMKDDKKVINMMIVLPAIGAFGIIGFVIGYYACCMMAPKPRISPLLTPPKMGCCGMSMGKKFSPQRFYPRRF